MTAPALDTHPRPASLALVGDPLPDTCDPCGEQEAIAHCAFCSRPVCQDCGEDVRLDERGHRHEHFACLPCALDCEPEGL